MNALIVKNSRVASVDNGFLGVSISTVTLANRHYLHIVLNIREQT